MHAFDRQTDGEIAGQTAFSSLDRVCIPCSAAKTCEGVETFMHTVRTPHELRQRTGLTFKLVVYRFLLIIWRCAHCI